MGLDMGNDTTVLAADTQIAKTWWAANREEAIAIACTSAAVGMLLGMLIGYLMRGPHA